MLQQKVSSKDKLAFERYEIYKKRLQTILRKKNPNKLNAVQALLDKYRGREHAVYTKVCAKYGIVAKSEWKPLRQTNQVKTVPIATKKLSKKPNNHSVIEKKPKPKHESEEESDEEYEDDFEDYSDDFEEEEQKQLVPAIQKHNIKSSKTNIIFEMRERTIEEQYLKRVGKDIYSRGIQSVYRSNTQTQTKKHKTKSTSIQYTFCDATNKNLKYDRQRLASFVCKASKVMTDILTANSCNPLLSDGITLICHEFLKNRSVNDIIFSVRNINIIAVAYAKSICVWDIRQPSSPIHELICEDEVKVIKFLPCNENLIVGGRQNGCIAVWDITSNTYPTCMTDCQRDANHCFPVIALEFLNDSQFCSVATNGTIHGWSLQQNSNIALIQQFVFSVESNIDLYAKHFIQSNCCVSGDKSDDTRILFAYQTSVHMLQRIGSSIESTKQYRLNYDTNNNAISVAFCQSIKGAFVAGYENGMICLFDIAETIPIRRFYDMYHVQAVLSVSSVNIDNNTLLCGLFQDGTIRFLDVKNNKLQPNTNPIKTNHTQFCKSLSSFVAMTNVTMKHTFSLYHMT